MPAGQPSYFDTPENLQEAIKLYFEQNGTKSTISGLAYHLGFESRQSLYDYEKRKKYSCIIKRARLFVESCYEQKLSGINCTGSIFALKNMGWSDKLEVDSNVNFKNKPSITIDFGDVKENYPGDEGG